MLALWADVRRWPSFVDGFACVRELSSRWPEPGATVVWESHPGGRGRVTEKVLESGGRRFATRVYEARLAGAQTAEATPAAGGSRVELWLEYELGKAGALGAATDLLFVRRSLRDALVRSLRRFAVEAEEDAGLR